jgi:hypothetical protein
MAYAPAALALLTIVPSIACAQQTSLKTRPGIEIGGLASHYRYEESSLGVKLDGWKGGVDGSLVVEAPNNFFMRFEGRYEYGKVDYTGSGTKYNNPDWYYELRALLGRDFEFGDYSLSPYFGIGFRYLYDDIRGVTSTGALGYTRESQYTYLPVGVTHRMKLESSARLATTVEAAWLIQGRQTSTLSDAIPTLGDVTNDQRNGYGLRGSIYYEKNNWSFGPWVQYWNIKNSDSAPVTQIVGPFIFIVGIAWEPPNKTTEIGLRLGYKF